MKALIHVAGETVFRRSIAPYRLAGKGVICSSSTLVPIALSLVGDDLEDLRSLIILPQSLVPFAESHGEVGALPTSADESEIERWVIGATEHLGELYVDLLGEVSRWEDGRSLHLSEKGGEIFETTVVQVRGTFPFMGSAREEDGGSERRKLVVRSTITFDGSLSHVFAEVFRFLDTVNPESITVDLSQGWNQLTLAAYLGAASYSAVTGKPVDLRVTEPYIRGVVRRCALKGRDGRNEGKGRQYRPPVVDRYVTEGVDLSILHPEELILIWELISDISAIVSSGIPSISIERVLDLNKRLKMEFGRYGGDLKGGRIDLMKALALLRRTSCAYSSVILPYLHMMLKKLDGVIGEVEVLSNRLRSKMLNGDYVKDIDVSVDETGLKINVHYELIPPLSFPLARAVLRASAKMLPILPRNSDLGEMPISMVDNLLNSYDRAGLYPNASLLINEFDLLDGKKVGIQDVLKRNRAERGVISKVLNYLNDLRGCRGDQSIDPAEVRRRDLYPFYVVLGSSLGGIIDLCGAHRISQWNQLKDLLLNKVKGKGNEYVRNLLNAFNLMECRLRDTSALNMLIRNLRAHAGVQHFSIRNVLEEGGSVKLLYYQELFLRIEESASAGVEVERLEGELGEPIRSICDVSP